MLRLAGPRRLGAGIDGATRLPTRLTRQTRVARTRSACACVADAPYLRNLALLVLLGTTGAALVDYLFKAQAVETFGRGDNLLRFFALYYAATSLLTFVAADVVDAASCSSDSGSAVADEHALGGALLAGSIGSLVAPASAA